VQRSGRPFMQYHLAELSDAYVVHSCDSAEVAPASADALVLSNGWQSYDLQSSSQPRLPQTCQWHHFRKAVEEVGQGMQGEHPPIGI
jgi:hypothetical protein